MQTRRHGRRCSAAALMLFGCSALQRSTLLLCSPLAQTVVSGGTTYKEGEGGGLGGRDERGGCWEGEDNDEKVAEAMTE